MMDVENNRIGGRIRGSSHGPQLININGDINNCLEEDDIGIHMNH
jgi:hypothetical protein